MPTIGFSMFAWAEFPAHITNPGLHLMGQANNGDVAWDGQRAFLYQHSDSAYKYVKKLNEMYYKGVMDQETFTQSGDQYAAKQATGRLLGVFDEGWNLNTSAAALRLAGMPERTMVPTQPTHPGVKPYYRDRQVMNIEMGYVVNPNSPRRAEAVAFINTMLEEKWQKIMTWGVEGVDYLVDADGRFYRTPEQRLQQDDSAWRTQYFIDALSEGLPSLHGIYNDRGKNSYSPEYQPEEWYATQTPFDKAFLERAGKATFEEFLSDPPQNPIWYPIWTISIPDGSDAQLGHQDYLPLVYQGYAESVSVPPSDFDVAWQRMLDRIARVNTKAYEDYLTEMVKRRIAEWGN
jgi:putative aldouronate transport system substrate-binding protein